MLFNSIEYLFFLPVVFFFYWLLLREKNRSQNLLILGASYVFYGFWDWRFLSLIFISTLTDYVVGLMLSGKDQRTRKCLLAISLIVNLGMLCVFKYLNFFLDNLVLLAGTVGLQLEQTTLNLLLPVGISFYTFQTLSYTIDVYRGKLSPTRNFVVFAAYVSFFPQLVAGPIERATNLLSQFENPRTFDHALAVDGMRQALWGLFKKIVIADNCAYHVNYIFTEYESLPGTWLIVGAILFSFQIYCDFSGYSDIAIGTAKLLGFKLMRNFSTPYLSRDVAEFWRRWHISLSTWFRDYVYLPMGGSRGSQWIKVRNVFAVFLISGFWHGANWTFIVWGFLNAIFFLPLILRDRHRVHLAPFTERRMLPSGKELIQISATFIVITLTWVFFRAESIEHAGDYLLHIMTHASVSPLDVMKLKNHLHLFILILICVEWLQRSREHGLSIDTDRIPQPLRWIIYLILIFSILNYGGSQQDFIYFQF